MKKPRISDLFLYRHRFGIGYTILGLLFISMLVIFPLITPNGLSAAEMSSSVTSMGINHESVASGDIVDLPYHMLQKVSIMFFGLTTYGIKLPSIVIGAILGFLFILLLNRWFKNNVAIMASVLAVLSSSFLYLAGSGTPLIMFVFWPTLLLWLGSKIQGENKPKPFYSFIFAIVLLFSLFTPYMVYIDLFIILFAVINPHLRFTIKNLPKVPSILISIFVILTGGFIVYNILRKPETALTLLFMKDFSWMKYFSNIKTALIPFFKWSGMVENTFLAPLIGLASLALALVGLISTYHGFFASRNSIATCLIVFAIIISGFNPECAILLILPLMILMAHGLKYILNKWYGLFPENPYARIFGIIPIALFMGIMITSDITHYVFGYRYNPAVANLFSNDLRLVNKYVDDGTTLVVMDENEYNFYKLLEKKPFFGENKKLNIVRSIPTSAETTKFATIHNVEKNLSDDEISPFSEFELDRIITNSKSENSDRIYIYKAIGLDGEESK